MAVKVTKGQICDGTISKNTCYQEYYLCGKFHDFMKKCTIFEFCRYTINLISIVSTQHQLTLTHIKAYVHCIYT